MTVVMSQKCGFLHGPFLNDQFCQVEEAVKVGSSSLFFGLCSLESECYWNGVFFRKTVPSTSIRWSI
jgi:hypothetical protein